jgi:tRNA A-37 threonylcarbamoyl transferase component Bud32
MPTLVGKTIGKYTLSELLGRGGMAEVYKARHPTLDRDVTVKVLHRHLADGEGFLARFEREAKAVAALRHPHIVQIFDYEATEDANYMVMEYLDGGTLQDRVSGLAKVGKFIPVRDLLPILHQVADALDYAHGRGILHRDVKPSNILLDSSGNAFLTDFGISRIMNAGQFTATGVMVGTPAYMSPEQGTGNELTAASDIYSLGIIAYELLAGKVPFESETTPLAVIHKHVSEPPPGLRALRKDLPAAAEKAVLKALAKKPKDRFHSAGDFIRELEKALPDDAVVRLDGAGVKGALPVSAQPTQIMEEPAAPARAQMPTEVMEAPIRMETTPPPAAAEKHLPVKKTETPAKKPGMAAAPAWPGWLNSRRARMAGIALAVALVIGIGAWFLFGQAVFFGCNSVEACLAQAQAARMQGNLPGFVDKMNAAIQFVPVFQHRPNAGLWCDKGDAERDLGRRGDAANSYNQCNAWTEGDPSLQGLRDRANGSLAGLK